MSTHRKAKVCPFISESGRMGKLSPRLHTKNWATQPSFQIPLSKIQSLYVKNGNNWPFVLLSSTKVVLEKTLESLLNCKEIQPVHPKGNQSWNDFTWNEISHWKEWCWNWSSTALATWCQELTHWKRLWCWERLRAGGEAGDRGWDGWISLTQ